MNVRLCLKSTCPNGDLLILYKSGRLGARSSLTTSQITPVPIMEIAGLSIGIAGLAGIFSTCLDVVERIDSSCAIISQFEADKLLFQRWSKNVGVDGKDFRTNHHANLDDPATSKAIQKILISINEIAGGSEILSPDQQHSSGPSYQKKKWRG